MFFFFNDTATTEIYTLSLHDALPISPGLPRRSRPARSARSARPRRPRRSEEHTSELQSQSNLVCRLLLENKRERGDAGKRHRQPEQDETHPGSTIERVHLEPLRQERL